MSRCGPSASSPTPCSPRNVFTALLRVFALGPELPWHTVLQKTAMAYLPALARGGTPIMVLLLAGVILWLLWRDAPFQPAGDA